MMLRALVLVLMLSVTACAGPPHAARRTAIEPEHADLVQDGRDIAEAQCARCHAVGAYGESPNSAAPPFRTVLSRYRADVLREELIQGIRVAHPMPEFQMNPQGVDALIAYLQSLQQPDPATRRRPS